MATDEEWPSDWLRGVLGLAVLAVLTRGHRHGYAIAAELADDGLGTVKGEPFTRCSAGWRRPGTSRLIGSPEPVARAARSTR